MPRTPLSSLSAQDRREKRQRAERLASIHQARQRWEDLDECRADRDVVDLTTRGSFHSLTFLRSVLRED